MEKSASLKSIMISKHYDLYERRNVRNAYLRNAHGVPWEFIISRKEMTCYNNSLKYDTAVHGFAPVSI